MSLSYEIEAGTRQDVGKGASRRLRKANKVPAIIYGADQPPQSLVLDQDVMLRNLSEESFFSHVLTVKVDGKAQKAVLKAVQRHPYKAQIMHVDLQRVSAKQKLRMLVPLHFLGEDDAPGVREGGVVSHLINEVEIECLPADLPEYIAVDVSSVTLNGQIHLSEIVLPTGVALLALGQGDEQHDQVVCSIHLPHVEREEEEETEVVAAGEVPVAGDEEQEEEGESED